MSNTTLKPTTINAADLLAAIKSETEYFELEGVGTVLIRSITAEEAQTIQQRHGGNMSDVMIGIIELGLVEPKLTKEQLRQLRDSKSGPVSALFERLGAISAVAKTEPLADLPGAGS